MLKFCVVCCVMVIQRLASAQVPVLSKTDGVEFAAVIIADSLGRSILFKNAQNWVRHLYQRDESVVITLEDSIGGKVLAGSSFFVYAQTGILKKISGKITYDISLEVKDNKYRYHFDDFLFHYYRQDRYYNMVETGKVKRLEDTTASGWQKLWATHKAFVRVKLRENIKSLKLKMAEREHKEEHEDSKKIEW